jgi:protein TonB
MKAKKEIQETREYGAPELKKNYLKNFRRGLEIAVIIHIVIVSSYLLVSYINKLNADDNVKPVFNVHIIDVELDAPPPAEDNKTEIPKTDEIVKPVKDLGALEPIPVSQDKAEELTIKTQDELNNIVGQISHEGDSVRYVVNNNGNVNLNIDNIIKDKDNNIEKNDPPRNFESFEVEKAPECVNLGMVRSSMEFPPLAIEIGLEGRVTVKVLVGTNGQVVKTGNMTGPDIFYDEVRDKAKNLEFTPGLQNGKPVNVWVTVPFSFKLKN